MLELRHVHFRFEGATSDTLRDVSLQVGPGQIVGLSGPSGAGKSTLGRILAGYLQPHSGAVLLDSAPFPQGLCPVQMLFQVPEFAMNPMWTIRQILCEAHAPDSALRQAFGIHDAWLGRHPHELSAGELQRISVVRALAPPVRYLVADEISVALDPITQVEIWSALRRLVTRRQFGILAISHSDALLRRIATSRCHLVDGILEAGPVR